MSAFVLKHFKFINLALDFLPFSVEVRIVDFP